MSLDAIDVMQLLSVGQKIYLYQDGREAAFTGKIIASGTDILTIKMSMPRASYLNAPPMDSLLHCAITGHNCAYRFAATYHNCAPLPEQLWYIFTPVIVERQQHRRFVRIPISLPIHIRFPNIYGGFKDSFMTSTVDVSGNGLCFSSTQQIELNSKTAFQLVDIPLLGNLQAVAVVKRCQMINVHTSYIYHVGLYLGDSLNRGQQEQLIKYVFQLQRKYLGKGIGI